MRYPTSWGIRAKWLCINLSPMGPRGSLGDNKNFFGQSGPYKFSAFKRPTATSGLGDGQKFFFVWGGEGGMDWGLSRFWLGLENVPQNLKFPVVNTLIILLNYFDNAKNALKGKTWLFTNIDTWYIYCNSRHSSKVGAHTKYIFSMCPFKIGTGNIYNVYPTTKKIHFHFSDIFLLWIRFF